MAEIKLTKNELRDQQNKLGQLNKYYPTLQLKKAMLQIEVLEASFELAKSEELYQHCQEEVASYSELLTEQISVDVTLGVKVTAVHRRFENIAGIEVPYFDGIEFADFDYSLFETPPWVDTVTQGLRDVVKSKVKIDIAKEKKAALENELRMVSIRVNLFEKILIPRAKGHIKKIKVFLGDQQLAAVSQAKVAKAKIEARKQSLSPLFASGGSHAS